MAPIFIILLVVAVCLAFPKATNAFIIVFAMPSVGALFGGFAWAIAAIFCPALVAAAPIIVFIMLGITAAEVWYIRSK